MTEPIPVTTLEDLLHHVEKRIYYKFGKYSEIDEYVQEARIHAWQDFKDGMEDRRDIVRRASNRVRNLILSDSTRNRTTGAPPKSKDFSRNVNGEATREKIRQYMAEFRQLHGRTPNGTEIANGTGLGKANVYHQLKNLDALRRGSVKGFETHEMPHAIERGNVNPPGPDPEIGQFENETVRRLLVQDYMGRCTEKERAALYYKFWEDRTNQGIADGLGGYTAQVGANWVKKGLERLRILMNADTFE